MSELDNKKEKEKKEESVATKKSATKPKSGEASKEKKKSPQKKKSSSKKIIPKNNAGDDVILLAKSKYKQTIKLINAVEMITPEQQEQLLLSIALGLVPDKFGLEAGLDTRLKALDQLQKLQQNKKNESVSDGEGVVITDDIS